MQLRGSVDALNDLGLYKEAGVLGSLAKVPGALWHGVGNTWKATGGRITRPAAKAVGWAGNKAVDTAGRLGLSQGGQQALRRLGRGAGREMIGFGVFEGGVNAALADPGDRASAFGKGFVGGAIGGLGWNLAGNATSMGIKRGLNSKALRGITGGHNRWKELAKPGVFSKLPGHLQGAGLGTRMGARAKAIGTAAVLTAAPMAAGMAVPHWNPLEAEGHPNPPVSNARTYAQAGRTVAQRRPGSYGLYPGRSPYGGNPGQY